jgi:hypothetical protein
VALTLVQFQRKLQCGDEIEQNPSLSDFVDIRSAFLELLRAEKQTNIATLPCKPSLRMS